MYDYMLEEMAEAIGRECHVDHNDVLRILGQYWQDKIAHLMALLLGKWRAFYLTSFRQQNDSGLKFFR